MPYIDQQAREEIDNGRPPETPGELNYAFSVLATQYIETNNGLSYSVINDIMGALAGAQAEFYRRVAAPYEDDKIDLNGDVY